MRFSSRAIGGNFFSILFLMVIGGPIDSQQASAQADYRMAQLKSQRMAQLGFQRLARAKSPFSVAPIGMRHVFPFRRPAGVRFEGVGYSAFSPADAIRNACHFGRRPIRSLAVVRGRDGYYATVFYH